MDAQFITQDEGTHIAKIASKWSETPYLYGGTTKKGADCSGSTWAIYGEAGYPYDIKYRPSVQFHLNPRFQPVPDNLPQAGDVGWWNGHVVIYAGNGEIWTAYHTGGPKFAKDMLHKWVKRKGPVKWYRYRKTNEQISKVE
jgi:cell wall-associated NlpC family hydrolase